MRRRTMWPVAATGLLLSSMTVVSLPTRAAAAVPTVGVGSVASGPEPACTVTISPKDTNAAINDKVAGHPAGVFCFEPGVYREFSVRPRAGQVFLGRGAATLTGSKLLAMPEPSTLPRFTEQTLADGRKPRGRCCVASTAAAEVTTAGRADGGFP